jgi:hypothetical protein
MNREDVIRMAREAGFKVDWQHADVAEIKAKRYEHFASLVAAAEREACAKLCDNMFHDWCNQEFENEDEALMNKPDAEDCKKAIRARGEK